MTADNLAEEALREPVLDPIHLRPSITDIFPPGVFYCQPGRMPGETRSICDALYQVGDQPDPRLPLDVCITGVSQWLPGTRIERRASYITGIDFVVAGCGCFTSDAASYALRPGDVIILHRTERHTLHAMPPDPLVRFHMTLWPGGVTDVFARTGLDRISHVRPAPAAAAQVRTAFEQLVNIARSRPPGHRAALSQIIYGIVLTVSAAAQDTQPALAVPPHLANAMRQVIATPNETTHVAQLARLAACSTTHLHRLFTRFVGMSPHHWLELTRMRKAAEHLCLTNMTVNQIADAFGYPDPFHFSKAFKRITGVAPSQYRARYRPHT